MRRTNDTTTLGLLFRASLLLALTTLSRPALAAPGPDFDAVAWSAIACADGDASGDEHPASVDLVGDAVNPAAYLARDASFLYLRYRVDGNPTGSGGFDSYAWNTLVQVPSGNPFQYQWELSLFGKSDRIEVWENTVASDIDFSPLFQDDAEVRRFHQAYDVTTPNNDGPLARAVVAGSTFGGNADWFVDMAFPIPSLIATGMVTTAAELDQAFFFPATSTNPNNYNKGHLDCAFMPSTALAIDKSVAPSPVPANATTSVTYVIAVTNAGTRDARGVVIEDPSLPSYLGAPTFDVSSDDAAVTWTVVDTDPLEVRVPSLPAGRTVTVSVTADASPDCGDASFTNVASAYATNAAPVSDTALLEVNFAAGGCAPCTTDAECGDTDACTTDACVAGACAVTVVEGCEPCTVDADCADANACSADTCVAGICEHVSTAECGPGPEDCDDGLDNDDDGPVDCDDDDCAEDPSCGGGGGGGGNGDAEVCGDCIDNDGDGLVDFVDPDCCAATEALSIRKLRLKPVAKKPQGRRLTLKARYAGPMPEGFDPMTAPTTIQIADPNGMVFCQAMPASAWAHPRKRVFRFRDRTGTVAGGLKRSRFKAAKKGLRFSALGRNVVLGETDGQDVTVTVAVGGRCATATTQLRSTKRHQVMIFP